ncbi:MAG TPA: nucleotidyltransferase family protein [Bryobacteraceae bacterium]|nr:nucleotidyltransferase family protein [Bryobacteraceae bacterium]
MIVFPRTAGIILAAGASSRMGSPKALLEYRGETFLNRLIRILSPSCDPVVVALAHHAALIRAQADPRAQFVVNPDPDRGQLSSLQTALAVIPANVDGFFFIPVDCPAAEPSTVSLLAEAVAHRDPATLVVVPQFQGKHGHPVFAAAPLIQEFLALPPTAQARQVVHAHKSATRYIDVDDPGILADIDDIEAYRRLAGAIT